MPAFFLYGEWMPGGAGAHWLIGLKLRPASVRGTLWRGPWRRDVLVHDASDAFVSGALVEVPADRVAVLDIAAGVGSLPVVRTRVPTIVSLRTHHAETWVLDRARARTAGFRPPRRS